jgi:hypothetical protein
MVRIDQTERKSESLAAAIRLIWVGQLPANRRLLLIIFTLAEKHQIRQAPFESRPDPNTASMTGDTLILPDLIQSLLFARSIYMYLQSAKCRDMEFSI